MSESKVGYKSLVEQVTEALMDRIEEEELRPGDKLPSTAVMMADFGVSRPVIREALKTLEGRGIIQISNGRTAVIQPVTGEILRSFFKRAVVFEEENLREVLEIRYGIEVQCARLAAERRTEKHVAELNELVREMRDQLYESETYTELDLQFHQLIAAATGNRLLYYLVRSIRDALRDMIREGLTHRLTDRELQLVQSTHEEIVAQIAGGHPEEAARAMAFHFDDAIRAIFEPRAEQDESQPQERL